MKALWLHIAILCGFMESVRLKKSMFVFNFGMYDISGNVAKFYFVICLGLCILGYVIPVR